MNERLTTFIQKMEEQQIDLSFIHSPANIFYLTGFACEPHERLLGLVITTTHDPFLICPRLETPLAKATGWSYDIVDYDDSENPWENIASYMEKQQMHTTEMTSLGIEMNVLSYQRAKFVQRLSPQSTFTNIETLLTAQRMVKDNDELAIMREAAQYADLGVDIGVNAIAEGKTEMEILAKIEYGLKQRGIPEMAFSTMVLSGEKAADPHGSPGQRQIQPGDFVLFDLGVVWKGYRSDMTRTVAFQYANDKQKDIYNTVLEAQEAAVAAGEIGTTVGQLDVTARDIITKAGYGDAFTHRIGHGIGIETHEAPSMNQKNNHTLQEGMVYTIEPGIYVSNVAGVRIEDDVVVTPHGPECLTQYPKTLQIVD